MPANENLLLAHCGQKSFALPLSQVVEVFELTQDVVPLPGAPRWVTGMVSHHGQAVILVEAGRLQGEACANSRQVILLRLGGDQLGLVVERVATLVGQARDDASTAPVLDEAALRSLLARRLADVDAGRDA